MAVFIGISGTCLSSFVLSIEMLNLILHLTQTLFVTRPPAYVQTTSPRSCRQKPFALNEVVDYRLALQAFGSAIGIPTSPSLPCATSSSEPSEVSPHNLLETRTILLDIRMHRAICADLDNLVRMPRVVCVPLKCSTWSPALKLNPRIPIVVRTHISVQWYAVVL